MPECYTKVIANRYSASRSLDEKNEDAARVVGLRSSAVAQPKPNLHHRDLGQQLGQQSKQVLEARRRFQRQESLRNREDHGVCWLAGDCCRRTEADRRADDEVTGVSRTASIRVCNSLFRSAAPLNTGCRFLRTFAFCSLKHRGTTVVLCDLQRLRRPLQIPAAL